jgi:hypothetical protein
MITATDAVRLLKLDCNQNNAPLLREIVEKYLSRMAPAVAEYREKIPTGHPVWDICNQIITEYESVKAGYSGTTI